jgi:hypothetical protein
VLTVFGARHDPAFGTTAHRARDVQLSGVDAMNVIGGSMSRRLAGASCG